MTSATGRRRVALFGASSRGLQCLAALSGSPFFEVVCFIDSDPAKRATTFAGLPVLAPEPESLRHVDAILIASMYADAIFRQLAALGVAGRVAFTPNDLARRFSPASGRSSDTASRSDDPAVLRAKMAAATSEEVRSIAARIFERGERTSVSGTARVACTICSNNYMAYAATLARSFLARHPDARFVICLADRRDPQARYPDSDDGRIVLVEASGLGIPRFDGFAFKYTVTELNTAVKPFLLAWIFESLKADAVVYLDPDILVLEPLDPIYDALSRHALVLVPHITTPYRDRCVPREQDLLKTGVYNLGFVGLRRCAEADDVVRWWQERLYTLCTMEPPRGLFVDQKWMDLAPALFPTTGILREPGLDVAYWNLHEQKIALVDGRFTANGCPLRFFHFSGVDLLDLESISKYQNRHVLPDGGPLRLLFETYRALVTDAGHFEWKRIPYAYGRFDNGVPVPEILRRIYRECAHPDAGNPFEAERDGSFFEWLNRPSRPDRIVTNLCASIHALDDRVRFAYPDLYGRDELSLVRHVLEAAELYDLDPVFLEPLDLSRITLPQAPAAV